MDPKKTQIVLLVSTCSGGILLAFAVGFWLMGNKGGSQAPLAAGGGEVASAPAEVVPNDGPVPPPAVTTPPSNKAAQNLAAIASAMATLAEEKLEWTPAKSGCEVEQTGTKIHISGTNTADGWGRENVVTSSTDYPVQDFEISTDFMMPQFHGPSMGTVILRAKESNFNQVTLQYYVQGNMYMLRWWTNSGEAFARTQLPKFGDEATAYHRLRLKYDAATHQATGWADDKQVGTVDFELRSNLQFVVGVSTEKKGNDIDVTFDHTKLTLAAR